MNGPFVIAIVEDEPLIAALLSTTLKELWIPTPAIQTCDTLLEYMDSLAQRLPCLAIVDLKLPDSPVLETLARLINFPCGQVPTVVISGYLTREEGLEAIGLGLEDFILKSASVPGQVRDIVTRAWARICARRALQGKVPS